MWYWRTKNKCAILVMSLAPLFQTFRIKKFIFWFLVKNFLNSDIINSFLEKFPTDYDKIVITGTTDKRRNVYRKFFPNKINPKYIDKVIIN